MKDRYCFEMAGSASSDLPLRVDLSVRLALGEWLLIAHTGRLKSTDCVL
jgi:hypothetical protein